MTLALLITAVTGAWAADTYTITFSGFGNEACNKTVTYATLEYSETFNIADVDANYTNFYDVGGSNEYVSISQDNTQFTITVKSAFEGTVNVTVNYVNGDGDETFRNISVTCVKSAPGPDVEVTTNAASEQDLFTEASFTMPTSDVTIDYELVRDMAVSMTTKIGDGSDGYRIRLKKSEQNPGKYEPADMTVQEMMALVEVHDAIEDQNLTFGIPGANCVVNIYAANENNQAEGNPIALQDLTPGRYIAKAVAAENSAYDGETAMSNIFELFEGFEVVVPAGEYATFYKDEPLYADPVTSADAELYTITSVSGDKAILSNAIETAPSRTPLLVYNKGTEEKTFLLIPANAEPNLALDVYDGFIGTMQPTVIPASNATTDNYAFNGKQFVWVMNEIAIGVNKAWLSIPKTNGNPKNIRIYRGNGEATGIDESIVNSEDMNSVWYDLNGRKLQGKPSLKGVYIKNGKKVIVP